MIPALVRFDEPLPHGGSLSASIFIVDPKRVEGRATLRQILGKRGMKLALRSRGRWLVVGLTFGRVVMQPANAEEDLFEIHREVIDIVAAGAAGGNVEIIHVVAPEVRARLLALAKDHALLRTQSGGHA